ncbi:MULTISPECIES: hypothetical protein [unclassified Acidocella]|nr:MULTISPECIES: hypothetical protein [unclassified Acidocella]WBO60888.1 hypothetical protein GT370_09255 [Acidocella sp. MX-AZ03]
MKIWDSLLNFGRTNSGLPDLPRGGKAGAVFKEKETGPANGK